MTRRIRSLPPIFGLLALCLLLSPVRADVPATTRASVEETRKAFHQIIDRPRVDLAVKIEPLDEIDGIAQFHFTYASDAEQRVPGILMFKAEIPNEAKKRPVVIALHGTGGNKDNLLGLLRRLAGRGFIAVAIDGRYHGERGTQPDYHAAIAKAFETGNAHPLYYDTVWDVTRLLDYLQTRPDVDMDRVGLIGFSKGGIETWLTAAIDPRIAVAVPTISVQSFGWGLEHGAWKARVGTIRKAFDAAAKFAGIEMPDAAFARTFYDRVIPGIATTFDGPAMLPLIAPRPLLVIGGDKDPLNPVAGLKIVEAATLAAYDKAGAADKFEVIVQPNTGHNVTPAATTSAVEWFVKWLHP